MFIAGRAISRGTEPPDIMSAYEICDVCEEPVHLDESDDNEGRHRECNEELKREAGGEKE